MAGALLVVIILISFTVVRIGAVALELTGLPWEQAKFQALSAFTTSGFTTRESELVANHPLRRRIVSWMMVLGNAGLVTTMGTIAGSLADTNLVEFAINFGLALLGVAILVWLTRKPKLAKKARASLQKRLARRYAFTYSAEELLRVGGDYVLTKAVIPKGSELDGKRLLDLKPGQLQVLAIERAGEIKPIPRGEDQLIEGDELIVYGHSAQIGRYFSTLDPATTQSEHAPFGKPMPPTVSQVQVSGAADSTVFDDGPVAQASAET